jgi:hypothetical protein
MHVQPHIVRAGTHEILQLIHPVLLTFSSMRITVWDMEATHGISQFNSKEELQIAIHKLLQMQQTK